MHRQLVRGIAQAMMAIAFCVSATADPVDVPFSSFSFLASSQDNTARFTLAFDPSLDWLTDDGTGQPRDVLTLWIDTTSPSALDRSIARAVGLPGVDGQQLVLSTASLLRSGGSEVVHVQGPDYQGPISSIGWGPSMGHLTTAITANRELNITLPLDLLSDGDGRFFYTLVITRNGEMLPGPFEGASGYVYAGPFVPGQPVPEPAAAWLFSLGLLVTTLLVFSQRRRSLDA